MEIILGIIIGVLWHIRNQGNNDENEDWEKITKNLTDRIDKGEL